MSRRRCCPPDKGGASETSRGFLALLLAGFLSACTVGPDYQRPDVEAPASWRVESAEAGEISKGVWWEQFQDPVLSGLVRSTLERNKDLEIATANVDAAFAQYGITRSALFPQVDASGSRTRERPSQNGPVPVPPGHDAFNDYSVNLSLSYELDVWGRLRRATESARAGLLGSEEGRRTVVLTLVGAVANGYIQLRALDRQLEIARSTSQSLGEAARLQQVRFREGAIPESDYRQAESQYETAAAQVPELERQVARQENFISVLLGRNPGPIERGRDIDTLLFPAVPVGLPASLLERRPDIRQAEQNLISANADIGVAKAAYFPRISLTALFGFESVELSDLFKGPSRTWKTRSSTTPSSARRAKFRHATSPPCSASATSPPCATAKARPSTWKSPPPSNRSSARSSPTSPRSPICSSPTPTSTRRWAAAGSPTPRPSPSTKQPPGRPGGRSFRIPLSSAP